MGFSTFSLVGNSLSDIGFNCSGMVNSRYHKRRKFILENCTQANELLVNSYSFAAYFGQLDQGNLSKYINGLAI